MLQPLIFDTIRAVLHAWDAVQVELRGRYSLSRLREVLAHAKSPSRLVNTLILVLTPLPPLITTLAVGSLPLIPHERPVGVAIFHFFFTGWLAAFVIVIQIHHSAPSLPLSIWQLLAASVGPGLVSIGTSFLMFAYIGFPAPFTAELNCFPWACTVVGTIFYIWKDEFRADPAVKASVMRYLQVFGVQCGILLSYVGYNIFFTRASPDHKTYVSFALPVLKLVLKNVASRGVYHMEDLAPSIIVFNVDAFHGMFVAMSMQQTVSSGTITFIMIVDIFQSLIALSEVESIVRRARLCAAACQPTKEMIASSVTMPSSSLSGAIRLKQRMLTFSSFQNSIVDYALRILDTNSRVANHPDLRLCRHLRDQVRGCAVLPVEPPPADKRAQQDNPSHEQMTEIESNQVECIASVLKMLHMIEFYVLIEFVEVVVAVIYTLYILIMSYMPNRRYYANLKNSSVAQIQATAIKLAIYAALELVSFVAFCAILDSKLQHMSTIQQLAFVMRKNWTTTHLSLILWVFLSQKWGTGLLVTSTRAGWLGGWLGLGRG